jgi:hypothetical protein
VTSAVIHETAGAARAGTGNQQLTGKPSAPQVCLTSCLAQRPRGAIGGDSGDMSNRGHIPRAVPLSFTIGGRY